MSASVHDVGAAPPAPRFRWLRATIYAFNANKTSWIGLVVFLLVTLAAIVAPWLVAHDPLEQDILSRLKPPHDNFYLGTDYFGRDILTRLLYGARISLVIGVASTMIAMVLGSLIGVLAGWYGGRFDVIVMQAMDILLAQPEVALGQAVDLRLAGQAVADRHQIHVAQVIHDYRFGIRRLPCFVHHSIHPSNTVVAGPVKATDSPSPAQ